ncbi:MAG: hypothetical protein HGA31_02875 [Candidatus Moranbacteria bacterium]|nr:hypothetical protein [Candidatus Moranbacteria bacterium]
MHVPGNRNEPERTDHHGLFSHESQRRQAEETESRDYHSFNAGESIIWWESVKHMPPILQTKKSYAWIVFALIAIIAYSLFMNSPLMAITFILIGMVGYLLFNHPDETVLFAISEKGITAGPEFYDYDSVSSFWIIENHPQFPNHLIIQTGGILSPRVHIPLEDNQPDIVRRILLDFIPEIKYEPNIIDTVERMFHI